MTARVASVARRRGAFGLDERRWPDPDRVEADLRSFLSGRMPEVWPLTAPVDRDPSGRTLALLMPQGRVAVLRVERDPARPGPGALALAARCRALRIPHAVVSSLAEGRAALRRLGVEPPPGPPAGAAPTLASVFGRA